MYKEISLSDIPDRLPFNHNAGKIQAEIRKFLDSGSAAAEVFMPGDKRAGTMAATYRSAAKSIGAPVLVTQRSKRLFLIRVDE